MKEAGIPAVLASVFCTVLASGFRTVWASVFFTVLVADLCPKYFFSGPLKLVEWNFD